MRLPISTFFFSLLAANAVAQERVPAFEFGLAMQDYVGKPVTVEGCYFVQATLDSMLCRIVVDENAVGKFWIETQDIPRDILKQAILTCAGLESKPACKGDVTGTFDLKYGENRMLKATITLGR